MKNIAFIIDSLEGGGAERFVLTLSEEFAKRGHTITIILLFNKIDYDVESLKKFANIYWISETQRVSQIRLFNNHKLAKLLKNLYKKLHYPHKYDIVISTLTKSDIVTSMAGIPNVIYRVANNTSKKAKKSNTIHSFLKKTQFKKVYSNKSVVTNSQGLKQDLTKNIKAKPKAIKVIPNPYDFDYIFNSSKQSNISLPSEEFILHIGRFNIQKRHDILLEAYAKSEINQKLVLLGQGKDVEKNFIQKIIKQLNLESKVIIAGFQKNPYPWIKRADLVVLSSDFEGLPNVIIESLILKTPVVSTDCPYGPAEILTGTLSEFLSAVGDVDALATNIKKALQNYPKIDDTLIERFDVKKIADEYLEFSESFWT